MIPYLYVKHLSAKAVSDGSPCEEFCRWLNLGTGKIIDGAHVCGKLVQLVIRGMCMSKKFVHLL